MKDSYLNINDITDSLKIDKDTLKVWIKEGKFPPPMKAVSYTHLRAHET